MNPGELRHRITIQYQNGTRDAYGALDESAGWSDTATLWASVTPIKGKELFAAESMNSEVTHAVKIRHRSGISADMRVKFGTRYFLVESVVNSKERNVELVLMCKELMK